MFLLSSLMIMLSSCNQITQPPFACTKIGCTDGISLALGSSLPDTAVIEILYGSQTKTLSCAQGTCIGRTVFIAGITPTTFKVKITNNGSILSESSHTPTYNNSQPNGPDCPPICKQAKVSISI